MATLHWDMRRVLPLLRDEGRLAVLTCLILHANVRNRCWPSTETICDTTGWGRDSVLSAKQWLIDNGAVELVPYNMRANEEKELPRRQHVYQLTGVFVFEDNGQSTLVRYLYSPAESLPTRLLDPVESRATRPSEGRATRPKGSSIEDSKKPADEKPRQRDIVFDTVGHVFWNFPLTASASDLFFKPKKAGGKPQKAGGRIATLTTAIKEWAGDRDPAAIVDLINGFAQDYKERYPDLSLPTHVDSLSPEFVAYIARLANGGGDNQDGFTVVKRTTPKPIDQQARAAAARAAFKKG